MVKNWVQELHSTLELYATGCSDVMLEAANRVSQFGMRELEIKSPKRSGDYSKSWRVKRQNTKFIVHNKDHYRLTHLLEKGHVNRDGSRTPAQPHMRKVEQTMIDKFEREIIQGVERL